MSEESAGDKPEQRPCLCAGCGRLLPWIDGANEIEIAGFRSRVPAYCSTCVEAGLSGKRKPWEGRVYGGKRGEAT